MWRWWEGEGRGLAAAWAKVGALPGIPVRRFCYWLKSAFPLKVGRASFVPDAWYARRSIFLAHAGFLDRVKLKEFDRQAGALFGLAKGVCWCVLITFFAVTLSESARKSVLGTYSGYYIAKLTHKTTPILPDEVQKVLGRYIEEFQKKLQPDDLKPGDPKVKPEDRDKAPDDRANDGQAGVLAWPSSNTKEGLTEDLSGVTTSIASSLRSEVDRAEDYIEARVRKTLSESGATDTGSAAGETIGTAVDSWIDRFRATDENNGAGGAATSDGGSVGADATPMVPAPIGAGETGPTPPFRSRFFTP